MFERILDYYAKGLWNISRVHSVVGKAIDTEEYRLITGEVYGEVL